MPRIVQRQVHRNNAPAPTPEDYYRINLTTDFLNHALVQLDSRFEDDVFVCCKGFSVIPSILLATDPIWKDNVREFCNHYRQDIPNYAGLPAELLLWERMWKGKKDRSEDIPDSIDATLEQIDKDAYVNIYIYIYIYIIQVIFTSEAKRVLYRKGADIPVDGQLNEVPSLSCPSTGIYIYIYIYIYITR